MHWFLKTFIMPLLEALHPAVIVEVGVELGSVTVPLLAWAASNDAVLHSIDPSPKLEVDKLLIEHGERLRFHRALSLDALPGIHAVDLALIDGDHNWYTVINELRELERRARADDRRPPVILLHDIGWPYGRRDLYYSPESIPAPHLQPHKRGGIVPGRRELAPHGVNDHLANASLEGTPANGVLTAVEDFIDESSTSWFFRSLPGLSGLGVLVPSETRAEQGAVRDLLDTIDQPALLRAQCEAIEDARLDSELRRTRLARKLAKTELRVRASDPEELAELDAKVSVLREQLGLLGELETQLHDALADSTRELLEQPPSTPAGEARAESSPETSAQLDGAVELTLNHRLALALSSRERLSADFETTHAALARALERAREQAQQAQSSEQRLRNELAKLRVELELSTGHLDSARHALARARVDVEVAEAERDALQGDPRRAPAVAGGAGVGDLLQLRAELERHARDRDELALELARVRASTPGLRAWERELELRGSEAFLDVYLPILGQAPAAEDERDPLSLPQPIDRDGLLVGTEEEQAGLPRVDIVVCVHDAPLDVRRCLTSLLGSAERPFHLIVVDDGSAEPTASLLQDFAARHPTVNLLRRSAPPHGYTLAANLGLEASTADYVVLLNSDTIPASGWLERLVDYGERHPRVGILGPLSNAASHQSIPDVRHEGTWARNALPEWLTVDGMALALERAAPRTDTRLPFLNGFCYAIKREVIDAIGYLDAECFAEGYCEENDYSHRAFKRGYSLAVVDDAYVYHTKSSSYGIEGRNELAKRHYEVFLDKHDRGEIEALVQSMEADTSLQPVREAMAAAIASPATLAAAICTPARPALEIVFILPGLADGGSGGSHSIYQEVKGLRSLGVPARIALPASAWQRAEAIYDDARDVFEAFADVDDLAAKTATADVISATHFKSVAILAALHETREDFLPAYYVQDYEPLFAVDDPEGLREASDSYTAIPGMLLFAKTHWLCNVVGARHGVRVAKVEPSIDEQLFTAAARPASGERARVIAMIRPRTSRRQPFSTLALLEGLLAELPDSVEVRTFGCRTVELARLTDSQALLGGHLGILSRAEVAAELRQSDVFLDMSTYQAFGRSALEAMACGCTAVVPQLGGAWEFAEHGVNALLIDTLDPGSALRSVSELLHDRDELTRMQGEARSSAARFSVVRAALSEYLTFERAHRARFAPQELAATPTIAA